MSSTIQEVVSESLNANGMGSYASHAGPVVTSLEARERRMAEQLIEFATGQGLDRAAALGALNEIGMVTPAVVGVGTLASADQQNQAAVVGDGANADIIAALNDIAQRIDGLTTFARQNGYNG